MFDSLQIIGDCVWNNWSAWAECTVKCGGGVQLRKRAVKEKDANLGRPCSIDKNEEKRSCNTVSCESPGG